MKKGHPINKKPLGTHEIKTKFPLARSLREHGNLEDVIVNFANVYTSPEKISEREEPLEAFFSLVY